MHNTKKLVKATVDGLFGKYTHSIEFQNDRHYLILFGENGVGKTKLLEIINHLSNLDYTSLSNISFSAAKLQYSDGSELTATRQMKDNDETDDDFSHYRIKFKLTKPGSEDAVWIPEFSEFHEFLLRNTTYVPIAPDLWEDTTDGEVTTFIELTRRYRRPYMRMGQPSIETPESFTEFCQNTSTYLINTQRLSAIKTSADRNEFLTRFNPGSSHRTPTRIRELSENIKEQLNRAQTEHSRLSQQKDRSFPSRVLQAVASGTHGDSAEIQSRYAEQNAFRDRLAKVVSVELPEELGPSNNLSKDWELALFDLYVRDATEKLEPFRLLLTRIELLQSIINERLNGKKLSITDKGGLIVKRIDDDEVIDLDSLSSGEQHEIILLFDLLFNVKAGTTVLIDEPEISLHIGWQISFIPDVEQIAKEVKFRFIVATHSPQIINGMWSMTTRLSAEGGVSS